MSIQSDAIQTLAYYDKRKVILYAFWQLIAELLPADILDLPFTSIYTYPESTPARIELSSWQNSQTWMEDMRTLFAAKVNTLFDPIVSAGYSWDKTRIKSEGIIYEDTINCERPALKIILIGPPTAKCRTVKVIEHVEEQEYIEAHDEEKEIIVCGDNIPEGAVAVEEV